MQIHSDKFSQRSFADKADKADKGAVTNANTNTSRLSPTTFLRARPAYSIR